MHCRLLAGDIAVCQSFAVYNIDAFGRSGGKHVLIQGMRAQYETQHGHQRDPKAVPFLVVGTFLGATIAGAGTGGCGGGWMAGWFWLSVMDFP